jgi:DedD protein
VNDVLKQRLVGALILVALGVVFWPIIFVQPGDRPAAEQPRIPPRPEVNTAPIEPPDQVGLRSAREVEARRVDEEPTPAIDTLPVEPEPGAVQEAVPDEQDFKPEAVEDPAPPPVTRDKPPEKLVMDSQGVPVAWILQVASVSSADKAEQLRQQLLQKDQKAYTRKIRRDGRELYRVYIGPKFERERLESLQAEVDREFGVKSLIVRYVP